MRRRCSTTSIKSICDTIRKHPLAALRNDQGLILNGFLSWGDYSIGLACDIGGVPSGESEMQNALKVGVRYRLDAVGAYFCRMLKKKMVVHGSADG